MPTINTAGAIATLTARQTSTAMLKIAWNETGGPAVAAPPRQGYGSAVIRDLLKYEFGGHVDLMFAADALRCHIELPANAETLA